MFVAFRIDDGGGTLGSADLVEAGVGDARDGVRLC